jgi:DUF2075 family protein
MINTIEELQSYVKEFTSMFNKAMGVNVTSLVDYHRGVGMAVQRMNIQIIFDDTIIARDSLTYDGDWKEAEIAERMVCNRIARMLMNAGMNSLYLFNKERQGRQK